MRDVLLVGSMPFRDEEECMRRALDEVGPYLFSLPDGEVGERTARYPDGTRANWVIRAVEVLYQDRENWRVVKEPVLAANGVPANYAGLHQLEPLCRPEDVPGTVRFGYDQEVARYYPLFRRLRDERGLTGLRFQMGIPTGLALGFVMPNPADRMRFRDAFNTVLAREVNAMPDVAGDDLIVQLEMPPEMYAAFELPEMLEELSVSPVIDLAEKIRPGIRLGLHLCVGDLHNRALLQPKSLEPMATLTRRLLERWPKGRPLEYIHYPLAAGNLPPVQDPEFYDPLGDIRLPDGTRFIAGFVHEGLGFEENARILHAIEEARGETVGVACSCGIGRRTREVGEELLRLSARLATAGKDVKAA